MGRAGRKTLNSLALASSLLCVATCYLWIKGGTVLYESSDGLRNVFVGGGMVTFKSRSVSDSYLVDAATVTQHPFGLGMYLVATRADGQWEHWLVLLLGPIAAVTAVLPAIWLGKHWRERQRRIRSGRHQCPNCSYDLTGNASGTCPECGAEIAKSSAEFSN